MNNNVEVHSKRDSLSNVKIFSLLLDKHTDIKHVLDKLNSQWVNIIVVAPYLAKSSHGALLSGMWMYLTNQLPLTYGNHNNKWVNQDWIGLLAKLFIRICMDSLVCFIMAILTLTVILVWTNDLHLTVDIRYSSRKQCMWSLFS